MAVQFKDYYDILGVSRSASQDEIKRAFRKLSRKYHPDVAENKAEAESKFKEVNEAYQVLKDPEKRAKYDRLGADWENSDYARRGPQWHPGSGGGQTHWRTAAGGPFGREETFHFGGTGFSDFFETFFGSMGGAEGDPFASAFRQDAARQDRVGRDVEADIMVTLEEALHGSRRQVTLRREDPGGRLGKTETYQVKIPPGVTEGQRIRLAGQGEPGRGAGRAGHLFLRVRLAAHPDFRVRGPDLYYDLPLAPWEAVLGCRLQVPTLTGPVSLKIPPGSQNGRKLRLRGHGLPRKGGSRGDLYVRIEIHTPAATSGQERKLWDELSRTSNFNPRNER